MGQTANVPDEAGRAQDDIGKGWVCGKLDRTSPIEGAAAAQQNVSPVFARLLPFLKRSWMLGLLVCVCVCILVYTKSLFLNGGN